MSVLQFFFTYSFPFLSFFPLFLIPILFGSKEINTYIPNIYQLSLKGATFPSFELVSFLEPTQNILITETFCIGSKKETSSKLGKVAPLRPLIKLAVLLFLSSFVCFYFNCFYTRNESDLHVKHLFGDISL